MAFGDNHGTSHPRRRRDQRDLLEYYALFTDNPFVLIPPTRIYHPRRNSTISTPLSPSRPNYLRRNSTITGSTEGVDPSPSRARLSQPSYQTSTVLPLTTSRSRIADRSNRHRDHRTPGSMAGPQRVSSAVMAPAGPEELTIERFLLTLHHQLSVAEKFFKNCAGQWNKFQEATKDWMLTKTTRQMLWDQLVDSRLEDGARRQEIPAKIEATTRQFKAAINDNRLEELLPLDQKQNRRKRAVERICMSCDSIVELARSAMGNRKYCAELLKEIEKVKKELDPKERENKDNKETKGLRELYGDESEDGEKIEGGDEQASGF